VSVVTFKQLLGRHAHRPNILYIGRRRWRTKVKGSTRFLSVSVVKCLKKEQGSVRQVPAIHACR